MILSSSDPYEILEQWTVSSIEGYGENDLLIFVDDTGQEHLSKGHLVYGFGGCALLGKDYDQLRAKWATIKSLGQKEFGVPQHVAFHATRHCLRGPINRNIILADFMRSANFIRFSYLADVHSFLSPQFDNFIKHAVLGVISAVNKLFRKDVEWAIWIFEKSDQQSPEIIRSMMKESYNVFYSRAKKNNMCFVKKSSVIPGLEWADVITWVDGKRATSDVKGEEFTLMNLYDACFPNINISSSSRLIAGLGKYNIKPN